MKRSKKCSNNVFECFLRDVKLYSSVQNKDFGKNLKCNVKVIFLIFNLTIY